MDEEIIDVKLTEKDNKREKRKLNYEDFLEKNKLILSFLVGGLILVGLGLTGFKIWQFEKEPEIEILGESEETKTEDEKKILIEIAGEVIKPGIYELILGNRINDLLTVAGGLSAQADREWVEKNINLAQKLVDGAKIYIPSKVKSQISNGKSEENKININTASLTELDSLWGIGEATAKNIIAGRPYQKSEELLDKKIIKNNVWEKIKDLITVF